MITRLANDIDMLKIGTQAKFPCNGCEFASVQINCQSSSYNSGVLTIKGSIDGVWFYTLGEPTISTDGIYGPFYVAGLQIICAEVTTVSSSATRLTANWAGWGCLK